MAVNPREPEQHEQRRPERDDRMRSVGTESAPPVRRNRTLAIIVGIVLVIAIGVVAWMALYSGGSSGGGSGSGGGGIGYLMFALSTDQLRRLTRRIRRR
jgi:hypothetical protein